MDVGRCEGRKHTRQSADELLVVCGTGGAAEG